MTDPQWLNDQLSNLVDTFGAHDRITQVTLGLWMIDLIYFPEEILDNVFHEVKRQRRAFPALADLFDLIREALVERGYLEAPDLAYTRARREASRYHPLTRPQVAYSSPAIAVAVAAVGGAESFHADDALGEFTKKADPTTVQIHRNNFMAAYKTAAMSKEHIDFIARHGTYAPRLVVPSLEVPRQEAERLLAHAEAHERRLLPATLKVVAAALPAGDEYRQRVERVATLPQPERPQLPAPSPDDRPMADAITAAARWIDQGTADEKAADAALVEEWIYGVEIGAITRTEFLRKTSARQRARYLASIGYGTPAADRYNSLVGA